MVLPSPHIDRLLQASLYCVNRQNWQKLMEGCSSEGEKWKQTFWQCTGKVRKRRESCLVYTSTIRLSGPRSLLNCATHSDLSKTFNPHRLARSRFQHRQKRKKKSSNSLVHREDTVRSQHYETALQIFLFGQNEERWWNHNSYAKQVNLWRDLVNIT